eukprot:Gb_27522 [translate_table: standard]
MGPTLAPCCLWLSDGSEMKKLTALCKNAVADAMHDSVSQYLRSKNWDTRVAAAQAIGAIAENIKHITVNDIIANAEAELSKMGFHQNVKDLVVAGWSSVPNPVAGLSFSSFDIHKVLEFGALLVASGGQTLVDMLNCGQQCG